MKCHYCGKTNDLRPYGPQCAMVCFSCAMSTPDRKAETGRNFAVQLDAAGPVAMLDGTEAGPYPAKHAKVPNAGVTGLPPAQTVELPPKPAGGRSELT